jgi:hypothetical protein
VLIAAGAIAPGGTTYNPFSTGDSASLSSFPPPVYNNPWLVGKDGNRINMSCIFVPAGQYSCDPGGNLLGWDPRFVSYSSFMDAMAPTGQAPVQALLRAADHRVHRLGHPRQPELGHQRQRRAGLHRCVPRI